MSVERRQSAARRLRAYLAPVLAKELRVAGRRKRTYLLRLAYVAALALYVALIWGDATAGAGSITYQVSVMADVGRRLAMYILSFQFLAAQVAVIVLMGGSINGEVARGTLAALRSTPLTHGQILLGKLAGGMVEVLMLLGISFPVLALIRVFGGVPWLWVIGGVGATLAAAVVTGTVAMGRSAESRTTAGAVVSTLVVLMYYCFFTVIVLGLALGALVAAFRGIAFGAFASVILSCVWAAYCLNRIARGCRTSFESLLVRLQGQPPRGFRAADPSYVYLPRGKADVYPYLWPGEAGRKAKPVETPLDRAVTEHVATPDRIAGSPVVWLGLRRRFLGDEVRIVAKIFVGLAAVFCALFGVLGIPGVQKLVLVCPLLLGGACLSVVAGASIAAEKESRFWPVLLTTPLTDWQILLGKAGASLRRVRLAGAFVFANALLAVCLGFLHPILLVHLALIAAGFAAFLTGAGLCFSAVFRRTGPAMLASLALPVFLWAVLPGMIALLADIFDLGLVDWRPDLALNPAAQVMEAVDAARTVSPQWWHAPSPPPGAAAETLKVFLTALFYAGLGVLLAWRAQRRFRRNVFA